MNNPNLIILWILLAKVLASSRVNPDVNNEVSNNNQIKSLTVLSLWSCSAFFLNSYTIGFYGLISIVCFDTMYDVIDESLKAYAFMILSMFAVHPYSPVTNTHGDSSILFDTTTFSTLSPNTSFINLQSGSNLAFSSSLFFFSSSESSKSRPSLVHDLSFFPS